MSTIAARSGPSPQAKRPKYLQIQERLLKQLKSGSIGVGGALPKEKELAASLGVAVGTLRHAIQLLVDEGVVQRIPGKGTFVNSPRQRHQQVRTNVFSLIAPCLGDDPIIALIESVEAAAFEMDHRVLVGNSNNEVARQEKLLRNAVEDHVAGVVLVPTTVSPTPADHIRMLREHHIPVVLCHRVVEGVSAPLVTWPHIDVGQMAARVFVDHGHERIVALADFSDAIIEAVGAGFRQVLREHDMDAANYRLHCFGKRMRGPAIQDEFRAQLKELLEDQMRPTALFCFNPFDAERVYLSAGELGFKIPDDLSLMYFGSDQRENAFLQRFTCVGAAETEVGTQAVKVLQAMEAGWLAHENNHRVEIPPKLLTGETVGPAPQGPSRGGSR